MAYFLLFFLFVLPHKLHAPIKELDQLSKSLTTLTQFLSKSLPKRMLATYEELQKVVGEAYKDKNSKLLDAFEQTVAVKVAKYLIEELLKEGQLPENYQAPDYIPLVAYVVEKAVERYPPEKTEQFNCVSLAAGDLENEFLLIRALRYVGYKTIRLTAIDIIYGPWGKEQEYDRKFKEWCNRRGIPISIDFNSPIQNGVNLTLFPDTYEYLDQTVWHKFPKNHLLLMIQAGGRSVEIVSYGQQLLFDTETNVVGFLESMKSGSPYIKIYFPYERSEIFVDSHFAGKEEVIDKFKDIINKSNYVTKEFIHRGRSMGMEKRALIGDLLKENRTNFKIPFITAEVDLDILFYDLIRATATDPRNPLAFEVGGLKIKELTDMSGSFKEVFIRYK